VSRRVHGWIDRSPLFSKCAAALLGAHGQEDLDWTSQQLQAVPEDGSAQDVTRSSTSPGFPWRSRGRARRTTPDPRRCLRVSFIKIGADRSQRPVQLVRQPDRAPLPHQPGRIPPPQVAQEQRQRSCRWGTPATGLLRTDRPELAKTLRVSENP
jgi:hypothetical protein